MLTETVRIEQNRAENAKPSQFSRVFLEVPGGLRRDKGILQTINSLELARLNLVVAQQRAEEIVISKTSSNHPQKNV